MAKDYKDWVRTVVANLKSYFFLDEWGMDLFWEEYDEQNPEGQEVAHIRIDHRYLKATLFLRPYAEEIFRTNPNRLLEVLVHEYSHILTEPMYDLAIQAVPACSSFFLDTIREQQTQRTALVILRGLPKNITQKR